MAARSDSCISCQVNTLTKCGLALHKDVCPAGCLPACLPACLPLNVKLRMGKWLTGMTPAGPFLCLHTEVLFLDQVLGHASTLTGLPVLSLFARCNAYDTGTTYKHHT